MCKTKINICYTCTQAFTVILKGLLEDSSSFNRDYHLTLKRGFPVIWLSQLKKIA